MIKKEGILKTNQALISIIHRILDIVVIIGSLFLANSYLNEPWLLVHSTAAIVAALSFQFFSEIGALYISWRVLSVYTELK